MAGPSGEVLSPGEMQAVRTSFISALTSAVTPAEGAPGILPFAKKKEYLESADKFMRLWERLATAKPKDVVVSHADSWVDRGAVFIKGVIRPQYPVKEAGGRWGQLYIEEMTPTDQDPAGGKTVSLEASVRAKRESLLTRYAKLAAQSSEKASEESPAILRALSSVARIPIERISLSYQSAGKGIFEPLVGMQVVRFLDGMAAYPLVYAGEQKVVIESANMLPGAPVPLEGAPHGYQAPSLLSPAEFNTTPIARMSSHVVSLVTARLY